MNAAIFLSLIFCFQTILCSLPDYLSYLCKVGSVEEVLAELKESSTNLNLRAQPLARHHARHHARRHARHYERHHARRHARRMAQLCFDEAIIPNNLAVLRALPKNYPIVPTNLLSQQLYTEWITILLSSNWLFKGQMISGQELFTSHLDEIPSVLQFSDEICWMAAKLGFLNVIKALVDGRHIDLSQEIRDSIVRYAVNNGRFEVVRYILGLNVYDKVWLRTTLSKACLSAQSMEFVKILCEEFKVDPNENNGEAALSAAGSGNVDLMKYLISRGLDLVKIFNYAFERVCKNKRFKMAKFLINWPGVNPAQNGNWALLSASFNYPNILDLLLQDHRVLAALTPKLANSIIRFPSSGEAKLTLLKWMTKKLTEVDMNWIPIYKYFVLAHPKLASDFQAFKNNAVAGLRAEGLDFIADFIEAWAVALESCAIRVSGKPTYELFDLADMLLSEALRS